MIELNREEWKQKWHEVGKRNAKLDPSLPNVIFLSRDNTIDREYLEQVIDVVHSTLKELGLDNAIRVLDCDILERDKRRCMSFHLWDIEPKEYKKNINEKYDINNWGETKPHSNSEIILSKDRRERMSKDFFRNLIKHELLHLLGYAGHHDETIDPSTWNQYYHGTRAIVRGYAEPKDCVMYWRCSTDKLCEKCKDAITNYWQGINDDMREQNNQKKWRSKPLYDDDAPPVLLDDSDIADYITKKKSKK